VRPIRNRIARFAAVATLVVSLAIAFAAPALAWDGWTDGWSDGCSDSGVDGTTSVDDGGIIGPFN
jgi:hypothetical protein